jgi:hypothetical protein
MIDDLVVLGGSRNKLGYAKLDMREWGKIP